MLTEAQHQRLKLVSSQNLQSRKKQHLIWRNYRPYPPCNYLHENWSEMNDKIQFMKLTVTSFSYFTSTKMSLVHTTRLGEPARAANTFLDREDDFRGFSTINFSFILSWRIIIIMFNMHQMASSQTAFPGKNGLLLRIPSFPWNFCLLTAFATRCRAKSKEVNGKMETAR